MSKKKRTITAEEQTRLDELARAARKAQFDVAMNNIGPLGFADYMVRESRAAGRYGIYLRKYNLCVAMFAANSYNLRTQLQNLFDDAFAAQEAKDKNPKNKPAQSAGKKRKRKS